MSDMIEKAKELGARAAETAKELGGKATETAKELSGKATETAKELAERAGVVEPDYPTEISGPAALAGESAEDEAPAG